MNAVKDWPTMVLQPTLSLTSQRNCIKEMLLLQEMSQLGKELVTLLPLLGLCWPMRTGEDTGQLQCFQQYILL